jgi:hypothetical protein
VQLKTSRLPSQKGACARCLVLAAVLLAMLLVERSSSAQVVEFDTTHTIFYEAPTDTHMFVYSPGVSLAATPWDWLTVNGGWEADVVSGASVQIKAGPVYQQNHIGADVVTTASVHDLRNSAIGGLTLRKDAVSFTAGYNYSIEHDYRSNSFNVAARTEAYEHNTQLEIDYAHNFDEVCNRVQDLLITSPTLNHALESSIGCFTSDPTRTTDPIAIDSLQASWSQAWTPVFQTQLVVTGQVINGFQSDPYRSVVIANDVIAQENVPNIRVREAIALRGNFFFRPIKAALRLGARLYQDSWDITSGTGEAEFEKYIADPFRISLRGRFYMQSGAIFWSDDYTGGSPPLGTKGSYWTGDRELSPFWSWSIGTRAVLTLTPAHGRLLRVMTQLKAGASFDVVTDTYSQYTLGGVPITGAHEYIGQLSITALF